MKCTLHNLGCKVNSYETEAMRQLLEAAGYEIVEFGSETADVYIINTCTVTNIADRKSRQMLHKAKKDNPNAVVVAAGCYVQEAGEKLLADEAVDIIVGNNRKGQIVEVLEEYFKGRNIDNSFIDINKTREYENLEINASLAHTRAYIKIQDGCNQFCTYCIIPFARGRVRSRKIEDIIDEVRKLAESGCHEIVVTGIHLSSYGLDFDNTESVLGQTIYEKDGCNITVSEIDNTDEGYVRISFEATGNYDDTKKEGSFISPVIALPDEENKWRIINSLPEVAPAEEYRCSFASRTCEYEKLINRFSIYVTKISFLDSEKEADDANRIVTIRFSNLWEMKWHKKS